MRNLTRRPEKVCASRPPFEGIPLPRHMIAKFRLVAENILASEMKVMAEKSQIRFPDAEFRLEEANLPKNLSRSLAGKSLLVEVFPEELPGTREVDPDDVPCWIQPDGTYWNDYHPTRVSFTDADGKVWRLPRMWLSETLFQTRLKSKQPIQSRKKFFSRNP